MVYFKEAVNGRHDRTSPVTGFAGQAVNVMGDVVEMAELQAKLARADAALAAKRVTLPLAFLLLGACGAIASLPVFAHGFSTLLAVTTVLSMWQAELAVGAILFVLAAVTVWIALRRIRHASTEFRRSAAEFSKNLTWLKAILGRTDLASNGRL
ncbi:MAG: phage holin family protein [Pirellulaceae bacterium]